MIADPEFVQFHPTAIDIGRDPAPLATEALRGDGAILVNSAGDRFMLDIHPDAELAPRDIVARGIFAEVQAGRGAFLDCREAVGSHFPEMFPTVYGYCLDAGIDPVTAADPVVPAAHYHMGGILTDADGRTSLTACGRAARSPRPVPMAPTAWRPIRCSRRSSLPPASPPTSRGCAAPKLDNWGDPIDESDDTVTIEDSPQLKRLRKVMTAMVGVVRDRDGLIGAVREIAALERTNRRTRFRNIAAAAKLIAVGALRREESRGSHFRSDFPAAVGGLAASHLPEILRGRPVQRDLADEVTA